ncbi:hypothetical protein EDD16DRAFT_1756140 [Pisolithus croceorrhizus]|nr:hypothetical protein EDD16DRAFT_1756140 [Pisolithus croceorrhizus]
MSQVVLPDMAVYGLSASYAVGRSAKAGDVRTVSILAWCLLIRRQTYSLPLRFIEHMDSIGWSVGPAPTCQIGKVLDMSEMPDLFTRVWWWSNPAFLGSMSACLNGCGVGLRWAGISQAVYLMIQATPVSGYAAGWRAGGQWVWSGKAGGLGGRHTLWKAELHVPSKPCYALSREPMGTGAENEGRSNTAFQGRGTSFRVQLALGA